MRTSSLRKATATWSLRKATVTSSLLKATVTSSLCKATVTSPLRKATAAVLLVVLVGGCKALAPSGSANVAEAQPSAPSPRPISQAGRPVVGIFGRDWVFVEIDGYTGPLPSPAPVAGFNMTRQGSRVTGTTACNSLSAGYVVDEGAGKLRFTNLRNNRALCDRVAADTEEAVLAAMIATDAYRIVNDKLELLSQGRTVARLQTAD